MISFILGSTLTKQQIAIPLYKYLAGKLTHLIEFLFPNNYKSISASLDPVIPSMQMALYGFKRVNEYEDLIVAVTAGTIEDINDANNLLSYLDQSSAIKALLKDSIKIYCKHQISNYGIKKSLATGSFCEMVGSFNSFILREAIFGDNLDLNFIYKSFSKSFSETLLKIPGSTTKGYLLENFHIPGITIISEYVYRSSGNTGKLFFRKYIEDSLDHLINSARVKQEHKHNLKWSSNSSDTCPVINNFKNQDIKSIYSFNLAYLGEDAQCLEIE